MMEKITKPCERAQQTRPAGCVMKAFTGIQYSATGVFGYSFRQNEKEVFQINSAVFPNPDIHLQGFSVKLVHRAFDASITILPGMRRALEDEHGSVQGFTSISTWMCTALPLKKLKRMYTCVRIAGKLL